MKAFISILLGAVVTGLAAGAEGADKDKPIKVEQAEEKIKAGDQLLDVRTKEEWDEGHLKGAKLLTLCDEGFADKAKAVLDSKKPLVIYCHSAKRSATAAKLLRDAGFTAVYDMAGGIVAWQRSGKPVVK